MKIGFVIDDSMDSNDGVQQYVRTLGGWLEEHGHQVHYLAGQSQEVPNVHSLANNIKVKFNGNRFTIPLPASSKNLQALLARERYEILHVQMPYSPVMAGKIIKQAPVNTAVVGTFHILPYGKLQALGNKLLGQIQRKSLQAFDQICFVSPAALAFAEINYGISGEVIPNLIDLSKWQNDVKPIPVRIIFLGRLVPRKGCKELLRVLAVLPPELRHNLEVIVAGDGPERLKLEGLARRQELNVAFKGYISETDKPRLLASAGFAVFPSLGGESFGIVLLEAMAAGSGVVIAGDNPGYRSVLGGLPECMIDFSNTQSAAQKLSQLLHNKSLRAKLHNAQQQMIKDYDTAVVGERILKMYHTALADRRKKIGNIR